MADLPFRTNTTLLTNDDLVVLDILFRAGTWLHSLSRDTFREHWNLGYSHSLNDSDLQHRLGLLCQLGIVESEPDGASTLFRITMHGGDLWSQERLPAWDRYCSESYSVTSRGRTLMSVVAVSPAIRDDFLNLWLMYPARRRTATIKRHTFLSWRSFPKLYVGMATYAEEQEWKTHEAFAAHTAKCRQHQQMINDRRSWWRGVPELQRFIP